MSCKIAPVGLENTVPQLYEQTAEHEESELIVPRRQSIVFFFNGNYDYEIEVLQASLAEGEEVRPEFAGKMTRKEYFNAKVNGCMIKENAWKPKAGAAAQDPAAAQGDVDSCEVDRQSSSLEAEVVGEAIVADVVGEAVAEAAGEAVAGEDDREGEAVTVSAEEKKDQ